MMHPSDELSGLWNFDSGDRKPDTPELLRRLERLTRGFDRTVRLRDWRESAAGLSITAIFLWMAFHGRTPLERAAHAWLAGCGTWIAFYYALNSRGPIPEQTPLAYQRALLNRYDSQIDLLRRARYWYVLPFWTGLLFSAFAVLERSGNVTAFALTAVLVTLVNAAVVWLNEGPGVRYLRNKRRELAELVGEQSVGAV